MAQQLGAFTAPLEDLGSIPRTTKLPITLVSGDLMLSFDHPWGPSICVANRHSWRQNIPYNKNK